MTAALATGRAWIERLGPWGATCAAALVAMVGLGAHSLWLDEAFSVHVSSLDWPDFWAVLTVREANQSLHYLLLQGWLGFGDGEVAVRLLSVVTAVATVPGAYAVAVRLVGRRPALFGRRSWPSTPSSSCGLSRHGSTR